MFIRDSWATCLCVCMHAPMGVFFYLLHTEYQNTLSTGKVKQFLGSENNFRGLFEGWGLVCRLKLELSLCVGSESGTGGSLG